MAKLEFTPLSTWQQFNFLGKRLFDFINTKINISTFKYVGDGINKKEIKIDLIPRIIVIQSEEAFEPPVFWFDTFDVGDSKDASGNNLIDGILGITGKKDAFIVGLNTGVNTVGINYHCVVFGS